MVLKTRVTRALEAGRWQGPISGWLAGGWSRAAAHRIRRPLVWPEGVFGVVVGGDRLGGSGKTPCAIAVALHLESLGLRVAFVSHGYRARHRGPVLVRAHAPASEVGDEACVVRAAIDRARSPIEIVSARSRQSGVDFAHARGAEAIVVDGLAQTRPEPASAALLAIGSDAPWCPPPCPPMGDGQAPRELLEAMTDARVRVIAEARPNEVAVERRTRLAWRVPAPERVGLFTACAHPERVERWLEGQGIAPRVTVRVPDHGPAHAEAVSKMRAAHVGAWVCTEKCAHSFPRAAGPLGALIVEDPRVGPGLGAWLGARLVGFGHRPRPADGLGAASAPHHARCP